MARDTVHNLVRHLLESDGWTITDDPLYLRLGDTKTFVDLAAERPLAAQKGERKIAVEIKSFIGASAISELEKAIGQFVIYRGILSRKEPERQTFLALPIEAYATLLDNLEGQAIVVGCGLKLILFDEIEETIVQWIE